MSTLSAVPPLKAEPPLQAAKPEALVQGMEQVDAVIRQRLVSSVALIDQIGHYIIGAGGKRIRPRLLLLFAQAFGHRSAQALELAATVEFIHTATLLHDDVVDESGLRRGRATANAVFGNAASVLVGDFLYSRAFQMMVSVDNMRVLGVLAEATNVIAEGEVLQLMNVHEPDLGIEEYLRVIRYKTAKLFEASARLGAILGQAPPQVEEACADFGRCLGTSFQIVDDLLDYEGESSALGKNVGDDLREGKPTLPILMALARCSAEDAAVLRTAVREGRVDLLQRVIAIVRGCGALEASRRVAEEQVEMARDCLQHVPPGPAKLALLEFCAQAVTRSS